MSRRLEATAIALVGPRDAMHLAQWADACEDRMASGERLVSLFGTPQDQGVYLTAVTEHPQEGLRLLRGQAAHGERYPSLTRRFAAAQAFERELWEQTGIIPEGHPWLKPIRFEGGLQGHCDEYPFFKVRGAQVHEVGVGPIHAGVIEPGHFRFMCHGETVEHLEIQLGYQHRGVENLLLQRPASALAATVETIVGDSSIAYCWGYCAAIEMLAGIEIAWEAEIVRGIALELERVAMHLATLAGMCTDIAFLQGGATYGRLRTGIINATMRICGSRFGRGWLRPGGVRFGLDGQARAALLRTLADFSRDMREVNTLVRQSRSVRSRLEGIGAVTGEAARELGLVGVVGKACGVDHDVRSRLPGALYTRRPLPPARFTSGDCAARLLVRISEIEHSVQWINEALVECDLETALPITPRPLRPNTLCVSVREGFRGPVVQALETDPEGALLRYKVQDPSLVNWLGLAMALRDNQISDFPICNKSFDLSYCGNDL